MNVLIQGASGGIGLGMTAQLLGGGHTVFASSRDPDQSKGLQNLARNFPRRLHLLLLDVVSESSLAGAVARVGAVTDTLHLIVNAQGLLHSQTVAPERRLEHASAEALHQYFAVNASGPLLVAKHFLPLMSHKERAVIANISARVGSIGDNRLGGWYGYRASKAAQNMMTKTMAIELKRRAPNVICVGLHPGTVDTPLSLPFQRSVPKEKLFSPAHAASCLIGIIESRTPEDSGGFFDWAGKSVDW